MDGLREGPGVAGGVREGGRDSVSDGRELGVGLLDTLGLLRLLRLLLLLLLLEDVLCAVRRCALE